jgi:N-acylglucosamine 2-epimerase
MFARLYNVYEADPGYLKMAKLGVDFLLRHATDRQGRYYFSLTREGEPWFYQRKPYGAVFAMLAYLEYFKSTGEEFYKDIAIELFWKIQQWIRDPGMLGRPKLKGVPAMSNLADVMVMAGMAVELAAVEDDPRYREIMVSALKECKTHFDPELQILMEHVSPDPGIDTRQWPEGRLFNPGHSIEVAWFIIHMLDFVDDPEMFSMALKVLEGSLKLGWDNTFGGISYFLDVEGQPTLQLESGMKLWWPHTEAIYALTLAFCRTEDLKWLDWLKRVQTYAFSHFTDPEYGEWFGYCDRQGTPSHTSKGGSYKGFYHVPRALLYSIRVIDKTLLQV